MNTTVVVDGPRTLSVEAADAADSVGSATVSIHVSNGPARHQHRTRPGTDSRPGVTEGAPVALGSARSIRVPAQTLTFSLPIAPPGAAIGPATGVFTWTPGEVDGPGTYAVTVRVTDGEEATAEEELPGDGG